VFIVPLCNAATAAYQHHKQVAASQQKQLEQVQVFAVKLTAG
jgi:hypothetical protein